MVKPKVIVVDKYNRTYRKMRYILNQFGIEEKDLLNYHNVNDEISDLKDEISMLEKRYEELEKVCANLTSGLNNIRR